MPKINPLFVTYKDGQIEGVKYPQLTAVLIGAVKQLKSANDDDVAEINNLKMRLDDEDRRLARLEALASVVQAAANDSVVKRVAFLKENK